MSTFNVNVKVDEIVDGFEDILEEIKARYLGVVILLILSLLTAISVASCIGATCGLMCYNTFCPRPRQRHHPRAKRTKVTSISTSSASEVEEDGVTYVTV